MSLIWRFCPKHFNQCILYHIPTGIPWWLNNRIQAQTTCLAILSPESLRKLLAWKLKACSLQGHNANLAFTTLPPGSFKATGVRTCYPLCSLFTNVAVGFSEEQTLTTLSKRSRKCLALESDLQEVLKAAVKASWRGIREWKAVIVSLTTKFPFPPRVWVSPLLIMRRTVCLRLPPWLTKSLIPAD